MEAASDSEASRIMESDFKTIEDHKWRKPPAVKTRKHTQKIRQVVK